MNRETKMKRADLSEAEVRERLALYQDSSISDALYDFGKMLLQDAVDRIGKLDTKASALAAYCGGAITILVSTSPMWSKFAPPLAISMIAVAMIGIVLAGSLSVWSTALQRTEWFKQDEWMNKDCLSATQQPLDRLRRFHLLAMSGVITSHQAACRSKIKRIYYSQVVLIVSAVLLLAAFLKISWSIASL